MSFLKNRKVSGVVTILLVVIFAVAFYMSYIVSGAEATRESRNHWHYPEQGWGGIGHAVYHKGVSSGCNADHSGMNICNCYSPCNC